MGIKTNFRNSLIILFVFLVQVIYGQVKYCEQYTHYCFVVTPPGLNAALEESYVNFRLEAPKEVGWLGLGIGEDMLSYLIVAWHNDAENKTIISQRKAESYVEPRPTEFQSDLILDQDNSGIIGDNFVVNFKRLRSVQSNTIRHKQPFVWAISYTNPSSSAFNATIEKHDWTGLTTLRLTQSGQTNGVLTTYDRYIIAHSTLMFIAWFIITPGSIFVARFGRNILPSSWFKIHWIAQLFVATPLVIIGFILPIVAVAGNVVFDETHQIVGLTLFIGLFVQLIIGGVHHKLYDPSRNYTPWWTHLHKLFGKLLFVLASFQVPLGLALYKANPYYKYIFYAYFFVLIIAYGVLSFKLWKKSGNVNKASGFKRMPEVSDRP